MSFALQIREGSDDADLKTSQWTINHRTQMAPKPVPHFLQRQEDANSGSHLSVDYTSFRTCSKLPGKQHCNTARPALPFIKHHHPRPEPWHDFLNLHILQPQVQRARDTGYCCFFLSPIVTAHQRPTESGPAAYPGFSPASSLDV